MTEPTFLHVLREADPQIAPVDAGALIRRGRRHRRLQVAGNSAAVAGLFAVIGFVALQSGAPSPSTPSTTPVAGARVPAVVSTPNEPVRPISESPLSAAAYVLGVANMQPLLVGVNDEGYRTIPGNFEGAKTQASESSAACWPVLSADGKRAAWLGCGENGTLHVLDITTGKEKLLAVPSSHEVSESDRVEWAPGGNAVAVRLTEWVTLLEEPEPLRAPGGLALADIATGEVTVIEAGDKLVNSSEFTWSPDGKLLAFFTQGLRSGIGIVDTSGREVAHLAFEPIDGFGYASTLYWANDSRSVAYLRTDGEPRLIRWDYSTGTSRPDAELYPYPMHQNPLATRGDDIVAAPRPDDWQVARMTPTSTTHLTQVDDVVVTSAAADIVFAAPGARANGPTDGPTSASPSDSATAASN